MHCVGYELMCDSLHADATALATELKLTSEVDFHCRDMRKAKLGNAGLVYLNDAVWPEEVRTGFWAVADTAMPAGSALISHRGIPPGFGARVRETEVLTVELPGSYPVSWADTWKHWISVFGERDEL